MTMIAHSSSTTESCTEQNTHAVIPQLAPVNAGEAHLRAQHDYANRNHADIDPTGDVWDPVDHSEVDTPVSTARTTFYVRDIDPIKRRRRQQFDRLWKLQTGRGHTYEKDSSAKTFARNDAVWKRCDAILQSCEVPSWAKNWALKKVLNRNLNGFSRHYAGADGACVGFALRALCDTPTDAKETWIADAASEVVPSLDEDEIASLIDFVFRKYGGDR
jgi:hypothetical protein